MPGQDKSSKKKKLKLADLVAISAGQVIGAGVVTIIGPAIKATGASAWLAYGVAVIVGFVSILPFIFISSTIVLQGGEYSIVMGMLGEKLAGIYAVAFITQCLSLSLLGTSMGLYLHSIFPNVNGQLVGILAVTVFFILNLLGVNIMANIQKVLTGILIVSLLAFSIVGFFHLGPSVFDFQSPLFYSNGFGGFAQAVSLYSYSTYGQYMVINFSKDAENPKRDIPLSIIISTVIILILYVSIAIVDCGVLPLATVSGQPLTLVAQKIFGRILFPIFIIGGPLMAVATTLNSTYGSRANPLLRAAMDGWFPERIGKCNRHNVPYIIMIFIFLLGIIPLLFNLSISTITSNLVLVGYLLRMVTAMAIIKLPKLYSEQWKKSPFHVPNGLFYFLMTLTFLAQIYLVFLSLKSLPPLISIINILFLVLCAVYAIVRHKSGKVHVVSSITFD